MDGNVTTIVVAELATSQPFYRIGYDHGREGRPAVDRDNPSYMAGYAVGYATTRPTDET